MKAFLIGIAIIAGVYFAFFYEAKAPVNPVVTTAVAAQGTEAPTAGAPATAANVSAPAPAAEERWWTPAKGAVAGFLLGGWFVGTLSLTAELFLFGIIGIPCLLMAILVEWADTRVAPQLWDNEHEMGERESHEIATSILCIVMLGLLAWGGVPIWATFMEHTWLYSIAYFVPVGLVWGCYRWDSFSGYLHKRLAKHRKGILSEIREHLQVLLSLRAEIRKGLKLAATDTIPNAWEDWRKWQEDFVDRRNPEKIREKWQAAEVALRINFLRREEADRSEITDEELGRWVDELGAATQSEEAEEENINFKQWLRQLSLGVTEKKPVRVPSEFGEYFKEQDKNAPKVSAKDHKGQIYLWTVFWPLSMSFRFVRWVITLKILRDIFNFLWNRLRFVYDRIAARHEVKFEVVERPKAEDPTPAPLRAVAKSGEE